MKYQIYYRLCGTWLRGNIIQGKAGAEAYAARNCEMCHYDGWKIERVRG